MTCPGWVVKFVPGVEEPVDFLIEHGVVKKGNHWRVDRYQELTLGKGEMGHGTGQSILNEIVKTEDSIKECFYRVESLESSLKSKFLTSENRERIEKELEEVKQLLKQHETELQTLRKENTKTAVAAIILLILSFLIYGLYNMFWKER